MKTIEEVEAMPIIGNAYHDRGIFAACNAIVMGDYSNEAKLRALRKIDQTMGVQQDVYTISDLNEYISFVREVTV